MERSEYVWKRVTEGEDYGPRDDSKVLIIVDGTSPIVLDAAPYRERGDSLPSQFPAHNEEGKTTQPFIVTHWCGLPGRESWYGKDPEDGVRWLWLHDDIDKEPPIWRSRIFLPPVRKVVLVVPEDDYTDMRADSVLSDSEADIQRWLDEVRFWCRLPVMPVVLEQAGPMHD